MSRSSLTIVFVLAAPLAAAGIARASDRTLPMHFTAQAADACEQAVKSISRSRRHYRGYAAPVLLFARSHDLTGATVAIDPAAWWALGAIAWGANRKFGLPRRLAALSTFPQGAQ
jgi:hypothetical protein